MSARYDLAVGKAKIWQQKRYTLSHSLNYCHTVGGRLKSIRWVTYLVIS